MDKRKKVMLRIVLIVILLVGIIVTPVVYIITHWVEKNIVTDIEDYEAYFGAQGIHRTKNTSKLKKTSESYLVIDNIFPQKLPESAEVEDFYYEYYNPWDPCYLSYLVYSCDENDYKAEAERLQQIPQPTDYLIYGATDFPYPLLAVNASDYGYIYALADEAQQKLIYVELTFCNRFTDIDYEKVIPQKYLPLGFDAQKGMQELAKAETPAGSTGAEKEETINNLKKQAEDEAELDRHFMLEALGDEGADGRWNEACGFIRDQYPDYFSSDELLQKGIKYGHYLVSIYKDFKGIDNGRGRYFEMGRLVSEMAQDIYTGNADLTDSSVSEALQKLEEQLVFFYGQNYGLEYKANQANTQGNSDGFTEEAVYVTGNPILSNCLFLKVNIDDIKNIEDDLKQHSGEELINGHFIYWKGEGIDYVTHSTMDGDLYAIILTTDQYLLGCGLKVGMKEGEIASLKLPFTAYSKADYPRDSFFLEDPGSPFQTQDYDTIYLYQFGRIPEDAVKENSIITGGRISITALVKDGIVVSVFTNIPVAG